VAKFSLKVILKCVRKKSSSCLYRTADGWPILFTGRVLSDGQTTKLQQLKWSCPTTEMVRRPHPRVRIITQSLPPASATAAAAAAAAAEIHSVRRRCTTVSSSEQTFCTRASPPPPPRLLSRISCRFVRAGSLWRKHHDISVSLRRLKRRRIKTRCCKCIQLLKRILLRSQIY